jgi:hypothetical protein
MKIKHFIAFNKLKQFYESEDIETSNLMESNH